MNKENLSNFKVSQNRSKEMFALKKLELNKVTKQIIFPEKNMKNKCKNRKKNRVRVINSWITEKAIIACNV